MALSALRPTCVGSIYTKFKKNWELEMKTPAPPPTIADLMRDINKDRLVQLVATGLSRPISAEYLPWDKMRYKTPPDGMTHDEWWLVTKFARESVERKIDLLRSNEGIPFTYALPDALLEGIDYITMNASGNITMSAQVTNSHERNRYIVNSLIEEAITSSQLEGAVTSRRVAKDMIRSGRPPVNRSERMIMNNYLAMRRVSEVRDQPLTPELIFEIHRIVTDGTLDDPDAAGKIQTDDSKRVAVWTEDNELLHRPPPVSELPERMARLCTFANAGSGDGAYMPPVLRSIAIHFMFGYDHYFEDGNGRTARAFFYWSLLRHDYWLAEFLTISRILKKAPSQYARSYLLTEQDDGDLTYFFMHHIGVVRRAIDELRTYLAVKAEELREIQRHMKSMPGEFNYRQLALLEHAVKNPSAVYTTQTHRSSHNVSFETARQDLAALEEKGYLKRSTQGRKFFWVPVADLVDRLRL